MIIKKVTVNVYIDTDDVAVAEEVLENCEYGFYDTTGLAPITNTEIVSWE